MYCCAVLLCVAAADEKRNKRDKVPRYFESYTAAVKSSRQLLPCALPSGRYRRPRFVLCEVQGTSALAYATEFFFSLLFLLSLVDRGVSSGCGSQMRLGGRPDEGRT